MITTLASLASSPHCGPVSVDKGGSTELSTAQPLVEQRYRIVSERNSTAKAEVTVRSEQGATVRVALVPGSPQPEPINSAGELVLTVSAASEGSAELELVACGENGCEFAFTLELELVEGSAATVEWNALASAEQCAADD